MYSKPGDSSLKRECVPKIHVGGARLKSSRRGLDLYRFRKREKEKGCIGSLG
jgi:hypothetical protein